MKTLSLLLAMVLAMAPGRTPAEKAAAGLARRIVPAYASRIRFVETPQTEEQYTLSTEGKYLVVKGNDALSMAVGLNRFLRDYCLTTVSWYAADRIEVPAEMPAVPAPVSGSSRVKDRFFLNYCTFGYTMPWWKWKDWERMIDWMALNGVNMPLAITGQEAVWQKVWRRYGLTDEEIRAYFTGPAHLPWHRMNNIDAFDGPLPQGWIDGQVKLQKQILQRERALGMRPVLPAFAGHVPGLLKERYPEAQITRLSRWGGFPDANRCHFLSSADPMYAEIQKAFLEEQTRLFGTDHLYGFDLFNEVEAPSWDPETLAEISRKAYGSVAAVDPDAVWIQMGWLFHYDRKHWQPDIMKAYLQAVPTRRSGRTPNPSTASRSFSAISAISAATPASPVISGRSGAGSKRASPRAVPAASAPPWKDSASTCRSMNTRWRGPGRAPETVPTGSRPLLTGASACGTTPGGRPGKTSLTASISAASARRRP